MKNIDQDISRPKISVLALAIGLACNSLAFAQEVTRLPAVYVVGKKSLPFDGTVDGAALKARRFATSDAAALLDGVPGASFYTGGGVSSLPVLNGLGDDRLKITLDGMSITSACPNHMNPALSYIDPAALGEINVFAGVVPVSQGGDSIGGAIAAKSVAPTFAKVGEGLKTSGNLTAYRRSNGAVNGVSVQANAATDTFNFAYVGNTVNAGNYKDGDGKEVVASHYKVRNNALKLAALAGSDLWTLDLGWQDIPVQGYPNQSMDMTYNKSLSFNAAYSGNLSWGTLEARLFRQHVKHKMDVLADKAAAAGFGIAASYMPMDTDAVDLGYTLIATSQLSASQTLRLGHEFHRYTLEDWWPPLLGSVAMEPNTFWNIKNGRRDRWALFAESDYTLSNRLSTQLGARLERVGMNTGAVQGYYGASGPFGDAYESDATSFNAKGHKRTDLNLDLTASARYVSNASQTYDFGFSRKNRSPNLHERYTWSSEAMMAGLMNNWFGDLNSYVGDVNLKPETAYSLKVSADWHDADRRNWELKMVPFYTYVNDYINAVTNTSSNPFNMSGLLGRTSLRFTNQDARLYGLDISGKKYLLQAYGDWTARASLSYTRGRTANGESLYNIMPLNGRIAIEQANGVWSNMIEAVVVDRKKHVSAVRAEQTTAAYALANYRASYQLSKQSRIDFGVDNLFNRSYRLPLGGLEYVSGGMMSSAQPLRAVGRSVNLGLALGF